MNKSQYFIRIFSLAEKKYKTSSKRLAAEGWRQDWQVLISTIMSAQSRDETTIVIAESLFKKYPTVSKLARAKFNDVYQIFKGLNYNRTKAGNVISAAGFIVQYGSVPDEISELIKIRGVGRKTANLIITEVHNKQGICVDTHVHRISNVFGFVKTKSPNKTEEELKKIVPKKYWSRINRIFVLWGKDVYGRDKERFLEKLK